MAFEKTQESSIFVESLRELDRCNHHSPELQDTTSFFDQTRQEEPKEDLLVQRGASEEGEEESKETRTPQDDPSPSSSTSSSSLARPQLSDANLERLNQLANLTLDEIPCPTRDRPIHPFHTPPQLSPSSTESELPDLVDASDSEYDYHPSTANPRPAPSPHLPTTYLNVPTFDCITPCASAALLQGLHRHLSRPRDRGGDEFGYIDEDGNVWRSVREEFIRVTSDEEGFDTGTRGGISVPPSAEQVEEPFDNHTSLTSTSSNSNPSEQPMEEGGDELY